MAKNVRLKDIVLAELDEGYLRDIDDNNDDYNDNDKENQMSMILIDFEDYRQIKCNSAN